MYMNGRKEKIFLFLFLVFTTIFLTVSCYYSGARYVGDTALYAQVTKNIAYTGKAESNIFANTQDFIDRHIAAIPVEERLNSEEAFTPPSNQTRNILHFHACIILYLIAPLCYVISEFACVTIIQSVALAFSLFFCILIMREKEIPYLLVALVCILLTAHPGWSLPAINGAFYPERIFMGTGMYLVWACEKNRFSRLHFIAATILCMMVGERGALYAGMFILAYTIFYWKEREQMRGLRLFFGGIAVIYAGIVMKFFLVNLYYSDLSSMLNIMPYLSNPQNVMKIIMFLLINICLYAIVAIADWRALLIGMAAMVPNLLYDVGGAEKIGWTFHYHVFYFVFLMWAVVRGIIKLYKMTAQKHVLRVAPYLATLSVAFMLSIVDPMDLNISLGRLNLQNNFILQGIERIRNNYWEGEAELRRDYNKWINENIPSGSVVTTFEGAMCELSQANIYVFPMGISDADFAVVPYRTTEEGYSYSGAVAYEGTGDLQTFNEGVSRKMKEYGFDLDNPKIFPGYGVAILSRK